MKRIIFCVCFTTLLFCFGKQIAYACSCNRVENNTKITYKQWLRDFDGVVFTGRVIKIERLSEEYELKVTFEVARVWKGVENTKAFIYTSLNSAICGVPYVEGNEYFVVAVNSNGKLNTDLCSELGYSKNKKMFMRKLGKGKKLKAKENVFYIWQCRTSHWSEGGITRLSSLGSCRFLRCFPPRSIQSFGFPIF